VLRLPFLASRRERGIAEQARAMLALAGIEGVAGRWANDLVWTERQLVQIARAMVAEPKLLLLDEPASGLNIRETKVLASLIAMIRDRGIAILVVEHDMSLVMDISDQIVVLDFGKKLAQGTPREIQNNREVIDIYLGEEDA
jgi:branched-chain amino acid transport system ATP-binding protein